MIFKDNKISNSFEIIDRLLKYNHYKQAEKIIKFIHTLGQESSYHNKKIIRRFIKYFDLTQNSEKKIEY